MYDMTKEEMLEEIERLKEYIKGLHELTGKIIEEDFKK